MERPVGLEPISELQIIRSMGLIKDRFDCVVEDIARVAQTCGRSSDEINLIVVTKTHPIENIIDVYNAGARNFGENYVEEAVEKMDRLIHFEKITWHMIGHIQSRKTNQVASRFAVAHSVDRLKIASRLDEAAHAEEKILSVFLECNVSGESSKEGWPAWDESQWGRLSEALEPLFFFKHLEIQGLMTMAPYTLDKEQSRPYFRKLRRLGEFLQNNLLVSVPKYSMGMSGDYSVAIEEGATHLRIGTAIMGIRT